MPTPVEEAAEFWAVAVDALKRMEQMHPRPSEEVFEQNRQFLREHEEKLRRFEEQGFDVETAKRNALEKQKADYLEMVAMAQAMSRKHPNQREFEIGGSETQQLYDQLLKAPEGKSGRADKFTCVYCNKTSPTKLKMCARCKVVSYCSRDCQTAHWKAHKKACVPVEKEPKSLPLTWDQVEAHRCAPVMGKTLEVRAILDEGAMRQVMPCKDRNGVVRRVAAYNNSRSIPGLRVGSLLRWKNPRFHYFMDGSSGARIEEADLKNIQIINN
ncbi:MYND finger domain containing protein [Nitzschia inconspicua]|uniref:phytol kinase n=1 Tax=Nitzschia inconspicua TaxID=303405 RepID=A0A9K3KUH2_9STRA|nr:MYND finger domain containing protein [Nitzschia inconspicua]